jgi:hypothetical protein
MEFGNLAEVLIHRWLKDEQEFGTITDLETQDEIWGEDERLISRIHGYQDFTWWTTDNHKVGLEIKSSFGRGIADIQHNHRPKPEHLVQVYFYLLWGDCDWFYLLYIGRDNGYRTSFRIDMAAEEKGLLVDGEFVPIDYEDIISRFIMIEFAVDNNNILPRDYTAAIKDGEIRDKYQRNNVEYKTDWQCNYCDWRRKCWADKLASGKMWHGDMEVA